jgi:putative membrane protein insertion efficiency factor
VKINFPNLWHVLFGTYRIIFTPIKVILGINACCRFIPTCSHYAEQALMQHGMLRGSFLVLRRILRCHPLGSYGFDPVPEKFPEQFCVRILQKTNTFMRKRTVLFKRLASQHGPRHAS